MELPKPITNKYFRGSWGAVAFVDDQLVRLKPGLLLTTTIRPAKSGGYYVSTAIEKSSDVIDASLEASRFSKTQLSI